MSPVLCPWIKGKSIKPYPGFEMEIKYKYQRYSDDRIIPIPFVKQCNHYRKGRLQKVGRVTPGRDVAGNSYRCGVI
jgi:hypothetical protein